MCTLAYLLSSLYEQQWLPYKLVRVCSKFLTVFVFFLLGLHNRVTCGTHLLKSSMLKNTYSPLATMLSSSAASSISRTVLRLAHTTTTARKEPPNQQTILRAETAYKATIHEMFRPNNTVVASVRNFHEYKFQLPNDCHRK